MNFEQFLFDDFDYIIQIWSKETGNDFIKEEFHNGETNYIYDYKSFRKWHHENHVSIDREEKLRMLIE